MDKFRQGFEFLKPWEKSEGIPFLLDSGNASGVDKASLAITCSNSGRILERISCVFGTYSFI